jgi:hypothetical protein
MQLQVFCNTIWSSLSFPVQVPATSQTLNVQVLPAEVKDAQQKKLEELKQQSDVHSRSELERKMALRYRKVKFFGINTYNMDLPQ